MSLVALFNNLVLAIEHFGYLKFLALVLACIILWRIHPVLGLLGAGLTLSLFLGFL